ncbi:zinc finger protein 831 [Physeter macrocephalus]|uniref:Zinc finger protein 831 n=1 Tax=Physeter macrocephalus TaxID=9755 RepID=A0A2Y9EIV0_PHYMC|nr:zinc finger protein 831 [Physeter catodon]|eukprot:XP_007102565.2 zinc finger protein 831 [Physeter catodon]
MEVPEATCPALPARDQPAPASGPPGAPGGQASPHLTLGPIILPPEQGLAPTLFLKALPIPLYHTVPPGGLQPRAPLVSGSVDGASVPFILSPLLQPEGPGPTQGGKPAAPALTVNFVGALPILSPGLGPVLGSPGKVRNAGKYLCPHCGRDCLKPSVLEKHIRSHTGERPFPCATCGIAFKTQSNLYKHRRTQTHLNNSRLSSESDGGGSSLPEEGDKAGVPSGTHGARSERPLSPGAQASGHCLLPTAHLSPVAKNLDLKLDAAACPGSTFDVREAPVDSAPGLPLASSQPRRRLPEQRSPTASRPGSAPQVEKPGGAKPSEGRLRKCESTDSGYLSRSDSAEQPPAAGSPLHSLSEHSAESEGEGGPGPGRAERAAGLELEKRRLEERIARLISHNQAVVDDPQLAHVRPRKTVLSKQGSIDLPMPYTYKDSFHFDLRPPEPRRTPAALRAARSTCAPPDRARPLFFHSVPTQLSTGTECVPVTRSNSLPFVEGTGTWREPPDPRDAWSRRQKPLSPRPAPARLADGPGGHPRALVRQAAVEDLPCPPTGDASAPAEDPDGKRPSAGEGQAGQGQAAGKQRGQRRLKMFSQEKWQVYGKDTFKSIYQKTKAGHHGGKNAREVTAGRGVALDRPLQQDAGGGGRAAPSQDGRRPPGPEDTAVEARPAPCASPPAREGLLVTEPPKQRETVARAGGRDQPRVNRAASRPANGRLELGCQLLPAPSPPKGGDLEAPRQGLPDPKLEGATRGGGGDAKETCQQAHVVPSRPGGSSGEPQPTEDKLPSERKKLKVEALSCQEPPGAGGETPGDPMQAASPPPQNQDSDPGEKPGGLPGGGDCTARGRAGALRQAGPRDTEPAAPGCPSQLASQPRAPGVLAAPVDVAFPPQYLLRLPQGETRRPPPIPQKLDQGRGLLCRRGGPEERASSLESGLEAPLLPSPTSGQAPGGADSFGEDPSWSTPCDRRKGVQGEEKGGLDTGTPAAGVPRGAASFPPTPTCDSWRSGTHDTQQVCSSSTWAQARPSGGVLHPWESTGELGGPPEGAPRGPSSGPLAGLRAGCSRQPGSFLSALPPPGWPELALRAPAEAPGSCRAQGPFPSLRAEPRLTWCCLSRSLPLSMGRREKDAAVHLALHFPGGSLSGEGPDAQPVSKAVSGGWTGISPGEGGQTQTLKLSDPTAPGMPSQDWMSEPEQKKGWPHRRAKMPRGSSKQKQLSIRSKRYKGNFLQSRFQLRASRLRKPHWVLRKDGRSPPSEGPAPRRTCGQPSSETAGPAPDGEPPCAASESSLCVGDGEKGEEEKEGNRHSSGSSCPHPSSRTVREADRLTSKEISPAAGKHGDRRPQNTAVRSGFSPPPDSLVAVANDRLPARGKGLDVGLLETRLPPPQEQVSTDPTPRIFSDAQEPSSFESQGTSLGHDLATSVAAFRPSLGERAGHTTLGIHSVEPQDHSQGARDTLTQSSPDRKTIAEGVSPSLLPGKPSSGRRLSGSVPLGSTGKTHLEIPASGPGSASSHQEEGKHKTCFPSGVQYGCGEGLVPCRPVGNDGGKCQGSGFIALKDGVVPSSPGQPTEVPAAPSKTLRKRSLEGMRKQTRVEFSDTSSDDEDRLVIEI